MPTRQLLLALLLISFAHAHAAKPLFSGPQVGEKLAPFEVKAGLGDNAGKTFNAMDDAKEGPVLIAFIHELTRPNIGLTRLLMNYASERKLNAKLVFLTNDQTETEKWMQRVSKRALPQSVVPLISTDGIEGPGVYGLNRNVKLTIVMGKDQKVTHNFATGQPSIQVDAPKLGKAIAELLGDKEAPTLEQMGFKPQRMRMARAANPEQDSIYREMMTPLIRGKSDEQVDKAAKAILEYAQKNPWMTDRVGKAASLIVNGGKVENYGIAKAQSYLKKWAKEFDEKQEQTAMKRRSKISDQKDEDTPTKDTTKKKSN